MIKKYIVIFDNGETRIAIAGSIEIVCRQLKEWNYKMEPVSIILLPSIN